MFEHRSCWSAICSQLSNHYDSVVSILSNRRSIEAFAEDEFRQFFSEAGARQIKPYKDLSDNDRVGALEYVSGRFANAMEIYKGQMIVSTYSYIEAMIKAYFVAVFTVHPNRMTRHVKESGHDTVKLFTRIINSPNKDEFIQSIAGVAASIATADGNNPTKLMARIAEAGRADSRDPMHASLIESLDRLKYSRNRLVHEPDLLVADIFDEKMLGPTDVHEALETFYKLSVYLRNLCVDNGVPVDNPIDEAIDGHLIYLDRDTRKELLARTWSLGDEDIE